MEGLHDVAFFPVRVCCVVGGHGLHALHGVCFPQDDAAGCGWGGGEEGRVGGVYGTYGGDVVVGQ